MHALAQDLRAAWRGLLGAPGFAAVAVLVLALGIGATTTIFTAANAILLRALPFADADRLYALYSHQHVRDITHAAVSLPDLDAWRAEVRALEGAAGYLSSTVTLAGDCARDACEPERMRAALVTRDFFDVLRARPALGRLPRGDEWTPSGAGVALLSDALWRRRFGGDRAALGRTLLADGRP